MKIFLTTVLSVLFFSAGWSQSLKDTDPLPLDPKVRTGVLPNGMKYYIRKNSKPEKRAELRLAVNAGSTYENDDQQGLAHFVEHMAFNGSKHFKKNDLVNYLEGIGTKFGPDLNAYTSFDETVYMLQIPTDNEEIFKKGFLILEDWACNLSFDSVEIEKERGVVTEEWRLGQGAFERMSRKYWPLLFKDSRYADRFPIGKPEILKNCKHTALKQYYYDWYRSDLQAIIVAGDVDVDATEKLIRQAFGAIAPHKDPRKPSTWSVPDQKGLRVSVVSDKESPYNIAEMMYFEAPKNIRTYADYREKLKRELFNSMIGGRLSEITKRPGAPIVYGGAGYSATVRTKDAYNTFALFANGKVKEAVVTMVTEGERVKRHGFTKGEFERAKKQMLMEADRAYNERDKTESKELVNEYVKLFLEGESAPGIGNEYAYMKTLIPGITIEEVNALAKQWIRPGGDNGMFILMMAEKDGNPIPTEAEVRKYFSDAEKSQDITPYEDKAMNVPLISTKPVPQKIVKKSDKGYGVTEWVLGNGVRVLLKPTDFKDDEVLMTAYSWGGTSRYDDNDFQSAFASNAVQEMMGYGAFDAVALEKYLQDKTASVHTGVEHYNEVLIGRSGKKDLETMLQLSYMQFAMPRLDTSGFRAFIEQQRGLIQNMAADPNQVFNDSITYIMSGYNPRYRPETEKTLNEIKLEKAYAVFRERFSDPADFVFVFTGSFHPDTLKPLVERYIGGISASSKKETARDVKVRAPKGQLTKTIVKGNEPRSNVRLMWTGDFNWSRKNRFEIRALTSLLNITLRENLREDKGGVYGVGISAQPENFPQPHYSMVCSFACAPDNVEKLVSAVGEEINKVKKEGCNGINLGKIKETLLKEREVQLRENNFWLNYICYSEVYKEQLSDIDLFKTWVNALKKDDFSRLAKLYFNDNEMKRFVLNPVTNDSH
jgi:zinc protease